MWINFMSKKCVKRMKVGNFLLKKELLVETLSLNQLWKWGQTRVIFKAFQVWINKVAVYDRVFLLIRKLYKIYFQQWFIETSNKHIAHPKKNLAGILNYIKLQWDFLLQDLWKLQSLPFLYQCKRELMASPNGDNLNIIIVVQMESIFFVRARAIGKLATNVAIDHWQIASPIGKKIK